ncbi:Similar to GRB14: Growth factor receptor-bound protein 14 (Bos taurus) [Cotesia congregata]|uniref:Similar to GRB14: Growth factor receptor-bound protein 14 (Bos taurus) n=1 Tax=Cotesia congregata TaxID=51543 RepID=A0A8J2HPU7_COTCN|nr:Similar to GRB14: Growth factor receptor-bound protein 14 (Bos taurus) [Cotesia congregata]
MYSADNHRILFAHLSDYQIYKIPNTKKLFNAPFQWGACLRPSSNADAEDTEPGVSGLKVIGFNTEKSHTCWHQAMRLAKYGKQLKDNYRAFKNKNDPASSGRTYNNGQILWLSVSNNLSKCDLELSGIELPVEVLSRDILPRYSARELKDIR